MHETHHQAARLAAAEVASAARGRIQLSHRDRVRIDVECVRRLAIVGQLDITDIEQGSRRQVVAIARLVLLGAGIAALDQIADILAIDRAALAVAGPAVEQVNLAATGGDSARNAPEIALQVAGRRLVLGVLVGRGEAQAEALHDGAEVVRAGDRPVGIAGVKRIQGAGPGHARGRENIARVLTYLLIALESNASLDRAVRVDDVATEHPG